MDEITITIKLDKIQEAVMKLTEESLKSSYRNPLKDAVEEVLSEKKEEIKKIVGQIVSDSLTNQDFKNKLGEMVLTNMIAASLKK